MTKTFQSILYVVSILIAQTAFAQNATISFDKTTHDFGTLKEEFGPVEYEFTFTNSGKTPLVIQNVKASCGCTTPNWSKDPIQPGAQGFVTARFNPLNRPGNFRKSLTITANTEPSVNTLFITGNVQARPKTPSDHFPIKIGQLRTPYRSFNFGKISTEKPFTKHFEVYNDSKDTITFINKAAHPNYISIGYDPINLAPGQIGKLIVSYNAKARDEFGFVTDNITLYTDEETDFEKHYRMVATIEEYFPPMSAEELAKAPKLSLSKTTHDFGSMKEGQKSEVQLTLSNTGKSDLDIRRIKSNCNCAMAEVKKHTLKPNESIPLILSFDASGRKGSQTKSVTIFSSDPANPTQQITIKARVND